MLGKLDGESGPDRYMTGLCRGFVQELTSPSGDSSWDLRQEISVKLSNVCSILQIGLVTTQLLIFSSLWQTILHPAPCFSLDYVLREQHRIHRHLRLAFSYASDDVDD